MKRFIIVLVLFWVLVAAILSLLHTPSKISRINVDHRGLISVSYEINGERKALDYLTPEEFKEIFDIEVTNYND